jgi:hypothetical protein
MAPDSSRAVSQPVLKDPADDVVLPVPRPPLLEAPALDSPRPAPRPPAFERARRDVARPAHESRAGWIVTSLVGAAAAWTVGWVTGVFWAWRQMTPKYLSRPATRR